jgi:hypothetical protein
MKTIVTTVILAAAMLLAATVSRSGHKMVAPIGSPDYMNAQGNPPPCGLPGLPPCPPKPPKGI